MVVIATCCEIPVGVDGGDRRLIMCYFQFGFAVSVTSERSLATAFITAFRGAAN